MHETVILSATDHSWATFEQDWRDQSVKAGEPFEDDESSSFAILRDIVSGALPSVRPARHSGVVAFKSAEDGRFHAACMFNHAHLPGDDGPTLRVRHLIVSPLLDYGKLGTDFYAGVLIDAVLGIVQLSETPFVANVIKFHVRSPEDVVFFRAFGSALNGQKVFASVRSAGAWLYITKS